MASSNSVSDHNEDGNQGDGSPGSHEKVEKHHVAIVGNIKVLKTVNLACDGMCCKFSETGEKLAVGLSNGDIKIFRGSTGKCIHHLSDDDTKADRLAVTSLNFIPAEMSNRGELLVATYASGMVKFWHITTETCLQTIHEKFQLLSSSLSLSKTRIIAGGTSENVFVYDVESGKKIHACAPSTDRDVMDGHRFRICALKYHPQEEETFLSGGWDDTIQIWDQRENHAVRSIYGPHICGEGIDFDERRNLILTASWRRQDTMQVWDYASGNRYKTIPSDYSYETSLYCGQWLGRDHVICGGTDNNMIRIVNTETLETTGMMANLQASVFSIDHDRHRLLRRHHNDVTMITALAGNNLYFMSNAPVKQE